MFLLSAGTIEILGSTWWRRMKSPLGFNVIFWFCPVETFPLRHENLHWNSLSSRFAPVLEWVRGICSLFLTTLLYHLPQEVHNISFPNSPAINAYLLFARPKPYHFYVSFSQKKKGANIYGLNVVLPGKKWHFLPTTRVCVTSFTCVYQGLLFVTSKMLRKPSPPKHCADFHGLHFYRVSRTFHHRRPSNQKRLHFYLHGPQQWSTNSTAYKRGMHGLTEGAKNRPNFILTR